MGTSEVMLLVMLIWILFNAGYFWFRGTALADRYPEAATPKPVILLWGTLIIGIVCAFVAQNLDATSGPLWNASWGGGLAGAGTATATLGWISLLVDARVKKLPLELTVLMGVEVFLTWLIFWILEGFGTVALLGPVFGAVIWALPVVIGKALGQVGLGDVYLAPVLGFALGTTSVTVAVVGLVVSFLLAAIGGLYLKFSGQPAKTRFPLGPFLLSGCWSIFVISALIPVFTPSAFV